MENLVIGWFMRFGTPVSILHDIVSEINNDQILVQKSTLRCLIKTTAGYAPFSNGVVERHNGIKKGMRTKLRIEKLFGSSHEKQPSHMLYLRKN